MYKLLRNRLTQVILIFLLAGLSYLGLRPTDVAENKDKIVNTKSLSKVPSANYQLTGKVRLSDGDSLKFNQSSRRARLFGIDSPELAQKCGINGVMWPCGERAKMALSKKISGKSITCNGDELDKHKRLIATCYLEQKDGSFENLNAWMVRNGWALAYRYYSKLYVNQEALAKKQKLGIWQGEFLDPYQWRKQNRR